MINDGSLVWHVMHKVGDLTSTCWGVGVMLCRRVLYISNKSYIILNSYVLNIFYNGRGSRRKISYLCTSSYNEVHYNGFWEESVFRENSPECLKLDWLCKHTFCTIKSHSSSLHTFSSFFKMHLSKYILTIGNPILCDRADDYRICFFMVLNMSWNNYANNISVSISVRITIIRIINANCWTWLLIFVGERWEWYYMSWKGIIGTIIITVTVTLREG